MRTTALAKDCVVAQMAKLVEDAHAKKSHTQGLVDNCAKYYIPGKQVPDHAGHLHMIYIHVPRLMESNENIIPDANSREELLSNIPGYGSFLS